MKRHGIDVVHSHRQQSDLVNALTPRRGSAEVDAALQPGPGLKPRGGIVWRIAAKLSSRFDAVVACSPSARDFAVEFGYRFPASNRDRAQRLRDRRGARPGAVGRPAAAAPGPPRAVQGPPHALRGLRGRCSATPAPGWSARATAWIPRTLSSPESLTVGIRPRRDAARSVSDVRGPTRSRTPRRFSSNHEALPMAGIEALGKGSPLVTTDTGDARLLAVEPWAAVPMSDPASRRTPVPAPGAGPGSATSCVVAAGSWPGTSSTSAPPGAAASSTRS
ncbi:hypothetical protein QJS66_07885 [Kocuria rhizophila]|nr:hypothetical protein QJS66_07885 [Kocuria rhizophila]